jgi:hypothetical protein
VDAIAFESSRGHTSAQRGPPAGSPRRTFVGSDILPGAQNVRSIRRPLDDLGLGIPIHGQPQNEVEAFVRHIFEGTEKQRRHT